MADVKTLADQVSERFGDQITQWWVDRGELTVELPCGQLREVCLALRDEAAFLFQMLVDVSGVDYLHYGVSDWQTESTTLTGFSRAVEPGHGESEVKWEKPRFASVYHLLSLTHNHRIRLKVYPEGDPPCVDSVVDIWPSANWYEREVFDLYGVLYRGHPDLRRILTDYGFIGHPFRKDFPLIGEVEMRYDATLQRCVYEPVSIQPRTLVPKVIRHDARYIHPENDEETS